MGAIVVLVLQYQVHVPVEVLWSCCLLCMQLQQTGTIVPDTEYYYYHSILLLSFYNGDYGTIAYDIADLENFS